VLSVAHARSAERGGTSVRRGDLDRFRQEFYTSLTLRADALFELTDAVLCADGPVRSLVELTLVAEHRRGHGAMYDALSQGRVEPERIRRTLAAVPLPRTIDGRIVLAVDVSPWLRSDAPTSADRLFCHVYGRGRGQAQLIPGWPYSFVAALEPGRTSWTAMLDAVRLGPADDATAVTALQLREVVARLTVAGHWHEGDPNVLIVMDSGYDVTRLAFVLADLPVDVLGRIRSDRVLRLPKPPRLSGAVGRPPKHGPEFALGAPATWPEPAHTTITETTTTSATPTPHLRHDGTPRGNQPEDHQYPPRPCERGLHPRGLHRRRPRARPRRGRPDQRSLPPTHPAKPGSARSRQLTAFPAMGLARHTSAGPLVVSTEPIPLSTNARCSPTETVGRENVRDTRDLVLQGGHPAAVVYRPVYNRPSRGRSAAPETEEGP
jgi:hypothetical protein